MPKKKVTATKRPEHAVARALTAKELKGSKALLEPTPQIVAPGGDLNIGQEQPHPVKEPAEPIPALTELFCRTDILVEFVGYGSCISSVPGTATLAKRLAMAFAQINQNTGTGIACDPLKAFEIIEFDGRASFVKASLTPEAVTMEVKAPTYDIQPNTSHYKPRHSGIPAVKKPEPQGEKMEKNPFRARF